MDTFFFVRVIANGKKNKQSIRVIAVSLFAILLVRPEFFPFHFVSKNGVAEFFFFYDQMETTKWM